MSKHKKIRSLEDLTVEECQVLDLTTENLTYKAIGKEIGKTEKFVGEFFDVSRGKCFLNRIDGISDKMKLLVRYSNDKVHRRWLDWTIGCADETNLSRRTGHASTVVIELSRDISSVNDFISENPTSLTISYALKALVTLLPIYGLALSETVSQNRIPSVLYKVITDLKKIYHDTKDKQCLAYAFMLKALVAQIGREHNDQYIYAQEAQKYSSCITVPYYKSTIAMLMMVGSGYLGDEKNLRTAETAFQIAQVSDPTPNPLKEILSLQVRGWAWGLARNDLGWELLQLALETLKQNKSYPIAGVRITKGLLEVAHRCGMKEIDSLITLGEESEKTATQLQLVRYSEEINQLTRLH